MIFHNYALASVLLKPFQEAFFQIGGYFLLVVAVHEIIAGIVVTAKHKGMGISYPCELSLSSVDDPL